MMEASNRRLHYPLESGFFTPSIGMSDYYRLTDKFEDLEKQIEDVEKAIACDHPSKSPKSFQSLELRLIRLEDTLEAVRSLVREYCKKVSIETNFTARLEQNEKRANAIMQELIHLELL